jgi:NOL1/NOP2/fmu family ribosome biogenesis protein
MDALRYLKRELNEVDSPHKSWVLATYHGLGIGWLKNLGNRINNYLPAEYRILMKID